MCLALILVVKLPSLPRLGSAKVWRGVALRSEACTRQLMGRVLLGSVLRPSRPAARIPAAFTASLVSRVSPHCAVPRCIGHAPPRHARCTVRCISLRPHGSNGRPAKAATRRWRELHWKELRWRRSAGQSSDLRRIAKVHGSTRQIPL